MQQTNVQDEKVFLKDYVVAHKKVSELGMIISAASTSYQNQLRLVKGIGIAVATTAIILGFFLSRKS